MDNLEQQVKKLQEQVNNLTEIITTDTVFLDRKTKVLDGRSFQFSTQDGAYFGTTSSEKMTIICELYVDNLPTSSAGLTTGRIWNDSGTIKVV